ncbi:dTDP-glucose 4,6-dehydratase [Candidatus Ornithobacterium hominis]|uniref:dTDP-glucose 4,6-dehydratase n=1 Tax=Candidatus Ornithobacterium hominis TaxID=2497989 RepID=A0A383TZ55_9FLAO|nr:GDP-mannose 4,6-dehydratase [Candidatus Ornithobacterium hominis]MCT7904221.1 GDP-mannose 4,6-dehydratase [Candidatus Ornithobacterium hominis]SZD72884.1 dTDP-glucose 4,6-dehydratase [Candidatus Ornithobacterium hominis]SZD73014.1 dTDP-glucose 4,6-dehydratase [Candidatus Ornithobacterium hominis]
MKIYLVTGGAGFIGSHLVENLIQKHQVIVVDNFDDFYDYSIKLKNLQAATGVSAEIKGDKWEDIECFAQKDIPNFKLYTANIVDRDSIFKIFENHHIDAVIHLAALAGVRPSIQQPLRYEEVNVKGSLNIFEALKNFKVKKLLFASSSSVYGNNAKTPFAESDPVDFSISPYAATKKSGEILAHVYHHLHEIDMLLLRFFTVYGPRQRPDLAIHKFTNLIENGEQIPFYGDGSTARDYTYIDDIIQGILKALDYIEKNENVYETLNLGENQVVKLSEMLASIEATLGKKALLNHLPMQPGDVNLTNADIRKAKKLIGYAPTTDFSTGIQKFVDWYRKNNIFFKP